MKCLIVTADDFGLCPEVNEAVVRAHTHGILTSASLMVGEVATSEAVELAKRHQTLKVGLHLTLVEGHSVLPHSEIPDLVDEDRRFSEKIVWSGMRYFFLPKLRRQITLECEAQIQKFLDSGLKMDHLNSHNHLHIHPVIADIILGLAKKYGIPAVRVPWQGWRNFMMAPWVLRLRRLLKNTGICSNDQIFGLYETGAMVEEAWLRVVPKIKDGVTEVYCHPATQTAGILKTQMSRYQHREELKALLSPKVKEQIKKYNVQLTSFSDISIKADN